jgi:hypothetical protein
LEVRGESKAVEAALIACASADAVKSVVYSQMPDGWTQGELRLPGAMDPREELVRRMSTAGVGLRHIEFHRPSLQDRWNEINNRDVATLRQKTTA